MLPASIDYANNLVTSGLVKLYAYLHYPIIGKVEMEDLSDCGAAGDLHFKMCKKIAQLTKVIYHLNVRNEDLEMDMSTQQKQYAQEITALGSQFDTERKCLAGQASSANENHWAETKHLLEDMRLLKMEKLIANEERAQVLKRHMYEQNIERLKKIAALEIFPSEDSGNNEETSSYG